MTSMRTATLLGGGETMTDDRALDAYEELIQYLDDLDEFKRELVSDMLRTWCWYAIKVNDLLAQIDEEGAIIDTPKGQKPNPANNVLHQFTQRKSDYYSKIIKMLPPSGKEALDALAAFQR